MCAETEGVGAPTGTNASAPLYGPHRTMIAHAGPSKEENSMKLTRRIANAGVCAALAGGAVLAGASSATAATSSTGEHNQVPSTTAGIKGHDTARQPTDPWIADQLATFFPSAAHQLAVFDPWIKDQLALPHPGQ
ncbi:hypothetical protein [Streptomyces sp. NPDC001480]|uniref:hypothetical protein n=1 Tax=Streptomyces sp. NPDC001480 TaxID=3364577 RepID=UPI00368638AD